MRIYRAFIAVAVLFAAATPAYAPAQVESTPIPAPTKPNFSSVQFMIGSWTCSTKSARRPAPYVTTVDLRAGPNRLLDQSNLNDQPYEVGHEETHRLG